jgi:uncharacterized membrane protein (UPF0127 family)
MRRLLHASLLLPTLILPACSADLAIPQAPLPITSACFVTDERIIPVTLELADDFTQRQKGLMARTTLESNSGMLFIYQQMQSAEHGFWMYKTLLHLDIAYLSEHGVIGNIRRMAPCSSANAGNCPVYPAGVEFIQAVEMREDFFADNRITVGDQLVIRGPDCTEN